MQHLSADLVVLGAGVFGLQLARQALLAGLSVIVIERQFVGAGASGGILGALMPHLPTRWNAKKAFQLEALISLEKECRDLERMTGISTGYGRHGRLMPVRTERFARLSEDRAADAGMNWPDPYSFRPDAFDDLWLSQNEARHGAILDTLSARLEPSDYLQSLACFVDTHRDGRIFEAETVRKFNFTAGYLETDFRRFAFGDVAICTGTSKFPMYEKLFGSKKSLGAKGQACLFACPGFEDQPIIYDDGIYIVPHANGTVAVGSTTQKLWGVADIAEPDQWGFLRRARTLCPALNKAALLRNWASVRPKTPSGDPVCGRVPGIDRLWLMTGGYKISFGIAHLLACHLVARIRDEPLPGSCAAALPDSFTTGAQFERSNGPKTN